MNQDFEARVLEAKAGNRQAKEWIVFKLNPLVISHSGRYGGCKGYDEDAIQDGRMKILEAIETFDLEKGVPFLGYVALAVQHFYQNRRRKQRIHLSLDSPIGNGVEEENGTWIDLIVDESVEIEEDLIRKETHQWIHENMSCLSQGQQQVVRDFYFNKHSLKTIAAKRGVHPITVAKTKGLALRKLRRQAT
ncbi:RNA polymerase, sigma-24 subunit, ECF subfamily [Alkaliphilus metalliredigens QYMF]|uniref:RNA polymerase, sigma-24 subunit, ECF subfamily n=1 Tax=Alkaliphilus metalliredigens (strain QYMF) TaxID=293826 RepID=A6TL74_ALKMQ|nr:sigma-70 family RNA polymerase sigma factor [Alkaliphilus metalliredigens]ABR46942.1 RNA polymerase, sigma-24 subunit, ECF subfamily [Alkaliphilus metalliredigens QYMF]